MLKTPAESAFAYAGIRQRVTELLEGTPDDEAASVTVPACPDWTVTDLVAHLYGVEVDIMDGNLEGAGTAAWADDQVRRFAPLGLRQLSEAWNETSPRVEAMEARSRRGPPPSWSSTPAPTSMTCAGRSAVRAPVTPTVWSSG